MKWDSALQHSWSRVLFYHTAAERIMLFMRLAAGRTIDFYSVNGQVDFPSDRSS